MKDESIFPPKCCGQAIPVDTTNAFITEELLAEYDNKREEFATTKRTYCSDKACSTFIPTRFIEDGIARCTRCEKKTCLNCLSEAHEGTCTDDPESQRVFVWPRKRDGGVANNARTWSNWTTAAFTFHAAAATNSAIAAARSGKPVTALSGMRNNSWRGELQ
ncbi:hypothetical protein H9Q72_004219 [Fusarium xylarioides]|uniref:IBR domain-containing protein n=1 Tax=Fusarium xylarioides TaxID=221167 RepID=A0A9P7L7X2_9HYPO|nr:hypothetical protein H9Q72_004219 [Fusarium xylarioides]